MKHLIILAFFFFSSTSFGQDYAYEHILNYHSELVVHENCELTVTEQIRIYAAGYQIKRGIYREIPLSYLYKGANVHVDFDLLEVKRDGEDEPYHTKWQSNGIRIYVGEENTLLSPGIYTYTIKYKLNHVLGFFGDRDELYWNVNGNGWGFSIDTLTAKVHFPKAAKYIADKAYTGSYGYAGSDYQSLRAENVVSFSSTRPFAAGENMTVSVGWSKGHLLYPSGWDKFIHWAKSYILWLIGALGLIIGFASNFLMWYRYGRDPKPGTIIPHFYAPEGMSPAECAYLYKGGRKSDSLFGAQLLSLAAKGHVKIDAQEAKSWGKDMVFTVQKDDSRPKKELNDIEGYFSNLLLGSKGLIIIREGQYNQRLKIAAEGLVERIDNKQVNVYYLRNNGLKFKQFIIPFLAALIGFFAFTQFGGFVGVTFIFLGVHVLLNILFSRLYEQPTKEGRRVMDHLAGFKLYMQYADKERIRLTNAPDMKFAHFEENLPFAMALGVAEEWAGQFDPVEVANFKAGLTPYFSGMAIGSLSSFSSNINNTISSASTPPASSGSSSGGGGFSGGGGGGGGGGGW